MDVTITMPMELLSQLHFTACVTEVEARKEAAMTARWEAGRPDRDRDVATHAACRLEKAEYRSQWLRDAVVAA